MKKQDKKIAAPYSKKKILNVPEEFPEGPVGSIREQKQIQGDFPSSKKK